MNPVKIRECARRVRDPVIEAGISKGNPEFEGEESKIVELHVQDLSAEDNVNQANVTALEGGERENAVDACPEVPRKRMPENPSLGCVSS